jgi:hypothetical protein
VTYRWNGPVDTALCSASVYSGYHVHQCQRYRKPDTDGGEWCRQHDPARREAERDTRRRQEEERSAYYQRVGYASEATAKLLELTEGTARDIERRAGRIAALRHEMSAVKEQRLALYRVSGYGDEGTFSVLVPAPTDDLTDEAVLGIFRRVHPALATANARVVALVSPRTAQEGGAS